MVGVGFAMTKAERAELWTSWGWCSLRGFSGLLPWKAKASKERMVRLETVSIVMEHENGIYVLLVVVA